VLTPSVEVTSDLVTTLIDRGGYTHPLFHPDDPASAAPLPGQGLLLLMGGLVEQSGELDDAIAMVELRQVTFQKMVLPGTTVRVRLEPGERTMTSSGKILQEYAWTAVDASDVVLAQARVLMLMRPRAEENG
jgi:hypothetical protein